VRPLYLMSCTRSCWSVASSAQ